MDESGLRVYAALMQELSVKTLATLNKSEINGVCDFLDQCPAANAYQYPYVVSTHGEELLFLLEKDGQLCFSARGTLVPGITRYVPGMKLLALNRGPVALSIPDLVEGIRALCGWARKHRVIALHFNPDIDMPDTDSLVEALAGDFPVRRTAHSRYTLRMPVTSDPETMLAALPKSCRYQIRRAQREGINIAQGIGPKDLQEFIAAYEALCHRKGLKPASPDFFQALWGLQDEGGTRLGLFLARSDDATLGANLFFRSGTRCEYLFGANYRDRSGIQGNISSGYPLQWSGILWGRQSGCQIHDFGGYTPGAKGGPAHMKAAFFNEPIVMEMPGGLAIDLMPALNIPLRSIKRIFAGVKENHD